MTISIRPAIDTDADAISAIYAHHVLHGTASYETEPPSTEETRAKIEAIGSKGWPFLVAQQDRDVAGFAYVTQFRDRAAYCFAAEDSIYIAPDRVRRGIGKRLLASLVEESATCGFRTIVAVIGGAEPASIALHRSLGFSPAGRLERVGFKFGRWLDSVYMQRVLR